MTDLHNAIERLRQFSRSWDDDDCVDEASGLSGADLKLVVTHALAAPKLMPIPLYGLESNGSSEPIGRTVSDKPLP